MSKMNATKRTETGRRPIAKLREAGSIPAVIYGHGQPTEAITISKHEMELAIKHGERLLSMDLEGEGINALIKDVQWDTFGLKVLHVDFVRVDLTESVEVIIPIHLVGVPEGAKDGGVLQQVLSEVSLLCPAGNIPEEIRVLVTEMQLNDRLSLSSLELPEGASLAGEDETFCTLNIVEQSDELQEMDAEAMPEVIGEKADEGDDSEA